MEFFVARSNFRFLNNNQYSLSSMHNNEAYQGCSKLMKRRKLKYNCVNFKKLYFRTPGLVLGKKKKQSNWIPCVEQTLLSGVLSSTAHKLASFICVFKNDFVKEN